MLDIRAIRENPDVIKKRLATKSAEAAALIDEVLACDETRRKNETDKQALQAERKKTSKEIGALRGRGEDSSAIEAEVKKIGEQIKALDEEGSKAEARQTALLLGIPNLPHEACPVGADENDNPEIRAWGAPPEIAEPKDHVALAEQHGLISFEDAVRISGSGFAVYRGAGAKLQRALIQFLLDVQTGENGYEEVNVPLLVKRRVHGRHRPASEVRGRHVRHRQRRPSSSRPPPRCRSRTSTATRSSRRRSCPVKMTAHTACFRREAGSAGRDNKGIIRMHQFDKIELVQIVHPDRSFELLEELTAHAESVLQKLGLHYRVIELCTGDLGFSAAKTYDIEVWAPGQGKYLEVSSCSCFTDYQARRMKLRFKDAEGKNRFCHTLNGSGTALPRLSSPSSSNTSRPTAASPSPRPSQPYFGAETIG